VIPSYDAQHGERCAYEVPQAETPVGHTFGNDKTYVSATAHGGVRGLWDADTDRVVFGTVAVAYRTALGERTLFPQHVERNFTFRPYEQTARFALDERVSVAETLYVPNGRHGRTVAFVLEIAATNAAADETTLAIFPWSSLVGQRFYGVPETDVRARRGATIDAWSASNGAARVFGASRESAASAIASREGPLRNAIASGALRESPGELDANAHAFGAFEFRVALAAGATETLRLVVAYDNRGLDAATATFASIVADDGARRETERVYATALADARVLTPSPVVSRGVVWAKANMLRIVKEYPFGWGSTNSPPSDILVSRDTSWFAHGFDYLLPEFSRDALAVFDRNLEPSGQVVEYVRGASGFRTAYDLAVNDDTPLHLIAMLHHYNATSDRAWVERVLETVVRVADYLLLNRDANGLLSCRATGLDMYGITSWRNIVPLYRLDGAVTEINAEAAFALRAAATLCAVAGDAARATAYASEAETLRERIVTHLFDPESGAFALGYDPDGTFRDDATADAVFPVLFEIAAPPERRAILDRLQESSFTTPVGLRTVPAADAWYFPAHGFGLLGGVWPDLTLWFAVALARNGSIDACVERLTAIYATMEEGAARNTVPGQFAEWFDGGSLTNRGMYLSPWTGAKYLWAVLETVCGMDGYRTTSVPHFSPLVPEGWRWIAAARVRLGGGRSTHVIDVRGKAIYGDVREATAEAPFRYVHAGRDVSAECDVTPSDVGAIVFEERGAVRAFVCNMEDAARDVTLAFRGTTLRRRLDAGELLDVALVAPGSR
jgi:glycogen debranching enzyme